MTTPSDSEIRALHEQWQAFEAEAPWSTLRDHDPLVMMDPESGEPRYCRCINDANGQSGLIVYLYLDGLDTLLNIMTGTETTPVMISCLIALRGRRDHLPGQDARRLASLGIRYAGQRGWPVTARVDPNRNDEPGTRKGVQSSLTASECRTLTAALGATRAAALLVSQRELNAPSIRPWRRDSNQAAPAIRAVPKEGGWQFSESRLPYREIPEPTSGKPQQQTGDREDE